MDTLAPEIIGEILAFTLAKGALYRPGRKQLLQLCLVCRTWRNAAYSTHELWSSLGLHHWFTVELMEKIIAPDRTYTDCARRGCSLTSDALVKFLTTGPYIHHLSISCDDSECIRHLISSMAHLADRLDGRKHRPWDIIKSLRLEFVGMWDETINDSEDDRIFKHLPPVQSFTLDIPPYEGNADGLTLNMPEPFLIRLKTFDLKCDFDPTKILNALQFCRNLEHFAFDMALGTFDILPDDEWQTKWKDSDAALLPKLKTLCLRNIGPKGMEYMRWFRSPDIEKLDIGFGKSPLRGGMCWEEGLMDRPFDWYISEFVGNSGSSLPRLRFLAIRSLQTSGEGLAKVFVRLPSLTHIVLDGFSHRGTSNVFENFGSRTDASLPNLRTLELLNVSQYFDASYVTERSWSSYLRESERTKKTQIRRAKEAMTHIGSSLSPDCHRRIVHALSPSVSISMSLNSPMRGTTPRRTFKSPTIAPAELYRSMAPN
ncbi:hypothetical protein NMY22_g1361 [Coprinellus aureogranulatus]|nr:hypothetical protein NMY22_g1361 [Coprinellus aureogranulatus]